MWLRLKADRLFLEGPAGEGACSRDSQVGTFPALPSIVYLLTIWESFLPEPRLVIRGEGEPPADAPKGKVGPEWFTREDLFHLRAIGLWIRLPKVQDAPFPGDADGAGGPGTAVAPDAASSAE